jgi:hypothetical protein
MMLRLLKDFMERFVERFWATFVVRLRGIVEKNQRD